MAVLLALLNIYGHRYELLPEIGERIDAKTVRPKPPRSRRRRTRAAAAVTESLGREPLGPRIEMAGASQLRAHADQLARRRQRGVPGGGS